MMDAQPTASPPLIDVHALTKRYGDKTVVDHISMRVERGHIHGFLGPNGSGKTTTIRLLCGLLTPDEGGGTCLGFDIRNEAREIKRQIGYMTQKFGLYEDLSIEENLAFIARIYQVPDPALKVQAILEQLGLSGRRKQLAGALSGGWKQRLALAACLLHEPHLLLLDEPTAGVDPKARREFWDHLHELAAAGLTVLVSTHYMDEAERCHRLAYIADGRLFVQGTPEQLVKEAGLMTYAITGPDMEKLTQALRTHPALNVAMFGATLHVSARSQEAFDAALASYQSSEVRIELIDTTLEDVFIVLMQQANGGRLK